VGDELSLVVPTTAEISGNIISQLEASLSQTIPLLPKSFARVLAKVLAGVFILLFKYAGFSFLQMFVAYATDKETTVNGRKLRPLVELGRLFGVGDPDPATRAELIVNVSVTNQVGDLPAGSQLVRNSTQYIYVVVAAVPLNAAVVPVRVRATGSPNGGDGSGTLGNLVAGDVIDFANPLPNVATKTTVASQAVTAADAESIDRYRGRILDRVQRRPQGGAYADYQQWGEEVLGIVNVYPYAGPPGQVNIYVEADEASSGSPDGIPTGPQLTAVGDSIELNEAGLATRRPVSAAKNVLPITRQAFDVQIAALSPDTPETRVALKEGIDEHLRTREPYIVGLSSLPRLDRVTQASVAGVVDTIVSDKGATISGVQLLLTGVPKTAYTLLAGEKAKLNGDPTYV
jgi:uncharacterized phage protein gp47/JayE